MLKVNRTRAMHRPEVIETPEEGLWAALWCISRGEKAAHFVSLRDFLHAHLGCAARWGIS